LGSTTELDGEYRHSHGVQDHGHSATIEGHVHNMSHTHNIEHTHSIAGHNHEIVYGIYEGPSANKFTIRVDGKQTSLQSGGNG